MRSIRVRLFAGYLGALTLLVVAWAVASTSTAMLRADYAHTVRGADALSMVVLQGSKLRDDEETGLRGYLLTGNRSFLVPYLAARRQSPALRRQADALAASAPDALPLILAGRNAADRWDRWAQGILRRPAASPRDSAALVAQQKVGKTLFDRYRAATDRIIGRLDRDRQASFAADQGTLTRMTVSFAALFAGAVALLAGLGWWTTRAIVRPLTRLGHAVAAIERGDLTHPVATTGAREFVALAGGMERMRLRLRDTIATLYAGERHAYSLVEKAPVGACITDEHGRFETVNDAYCALSGYTRAELIGQPFTRVIPAASQAESAQAYAGSLNAGADARGEYAIITKAGHIITILASTVTLRGRDGRPTRASFVVDISARKQMEEHLAHQAHHDALTGLPNRALFGDRLAQALRAADRERTPVALLLLDLNRFKEVNDTLGHDAGDALLRVVGARLQGAVRTSDTVARLGGDEFAALLPATGADGAVDVAAKLLGALAEPLTLEGQRLDIGASVGIAVGPAHGADAGALLRHADVAMYSAKRAGDGYAVYAAGRDTHNPARLALVGELRRAIAAGALRLHYQPIVDLASGRPLSVEALVRWPHPEHGLLAPDQFIPLAEQTGLIAPLTDWVLEEALRQCCAWDDAGMAVDIAVNLSARALGDDVLPERIAALLARCPLAPGRLTLEITESSVMADPERAGAVLARLRAVGVRLSIDDFGTGHSSLGLLQRLPVDELKVDRSFVTHLMETGDASIVACILGLGRTRGLRVVVEGVETRGVWDTLLALDGDAAQGYGISRPLPAAEVERWLQATAHAVA
jgi:diguanylate cyclase (GGDEF)-like protein/PAS domain S-box-containing protein